MSFNRPINLSTSLHRSIDQNLPLHHPISVLLSITIYLHVALSTSIYCASFFFDACQTYVPLGLYVYLPNNPTTSRLYCPYSDLCLYVLLSTSTVHLLATSIYLYVLATSTSDLVRRPAVDLSILLLFQPLRPPIASSYWPTSPSSYRTFSTSPSLRPLPFTSFDLCVHISTPIYLYVLLWPQRPPPTTTSSFCPLPLRPPIKNFQPLRPLHVPLSTST